MIFLTILGLKNMQFRLVLEGKTGKEIPESSKVLRKGFSKQFCFIRCRRQHLSAVEERRYSRFTFVENSIGNFPKIPRAKFMRSDRLFYFSSICQFGTFQNSFATITSLSELSFRFRRFILLVQTKKVISMNYGSSTSS